LKDVPATGGRVGPADLGAEAGELGLERDNAVEQLLLVHVLPSLPRKAKSLGDAEARRKRRDESGVEADDVDHELGRPGAAGVVGGPATLTMRSTPPASGPSPWRES
jgi:hypothetical protein